jgi:DNA adenine methylase
MENTSESYYASRDEFNRLIQTNLWNTAKAAQLWYYMNRTCYNGLCRFSSRYGEKFNSPYGKYKNIKYVKNFSSVKAAIERWTLVSLDFSKIVTVEGDLIYADPPYDTEFTKYTAQDFKWDDQLRLVEYLCNSGQKIVASNQATDRIVDLYKSHGFDYKILDAPRRISCNGDRTPAREILAWKGF